MSNLKLEITESLMCDNTGIVVKTLCELRKLGIKIAIDDFGTGHSSLARLKNFPVNDLKIDSSLIEHAATTQEDAAIAIAILTLARELGLDVVAEGIETREQADFIRNQGCSHGQGFYYSHPLTPDKLCAFFQDGTTKQINAQ